MSADDKKVAAPATSSAVQTKVKPIARTAKTKKALPVVPASGFSLRRGVNAFSSRRADFYEDLAEALEDRAVLVLELEKHLARARKKKSPLAGLFALWLRRMDTSTLSASMKGTVPAMDSLVLQASETSGNLVNGLRFLSFSVRAVAKIKAVIMGAITMPLIVGCMIVGMLYGFGAFMVPILEAIVPVDKWPAMGKLMFTLSSAVMNYGVLIGATVAGLILWLRWALPNWSGPVRKKFDNVMPFSVYRDYNGAVMLVSLSGLMQSGASLVGSLKSMKASSPPWLAWHIGQVLLKLDKEAKSPAKAFDTGVLPEELLERVIDYGERSGFQSALKKIGAQALEKLDKSIQAKAKLVNSLLLFVSGTLMALIIGSVMLTAQEAKQQMNTKQSTELTDK